MNNVILSSITPKWKWDVFEDDRLFVVETLNDIPFARRLLCKILLGSKFTKIQEKK